MEFSVPLLHLLEVDTCLMQLHLSCPLSVRLIQILLLVREISSKDNDEIDLKPLSFLFLFTSWFYFNRLNFLLIWLIRESKRHNRASVKKLFKPISQKKNRKNSQPDTALFFSFTFIFLQNICRKNKIPSANVQVNNFVRWRHCLNSIKRIGCV